MIDLVFKVRVAQGAFTLDVDERSRVEVLGLFGASGAGKTTMLETIAGIRRPSQGEIAVGGDTLYSSAFGIDRPPRDRHIGYVPQEALLFPHMSVHGNLVYGVRAASKDAVGMLRSVAEMLEIGALLERRTQGLSGGERQRVALGRALMTRPSLLLLDEPLAAVDRARRERILPYVLRIRRELHVPLIYVTHDAGELLEIADRVLVLEEGRVTMAGAPGGVLSRDQGSGIGGRGSGAEGSGSRDQGGGERE
jgi:molybdate transport system ATP-binding protein